MALTVGDRPVRPLTQDEVLRMVDAGILGEDEPVELLHGVLTTVSSKAPAHEAVKMRLGRSLAGGFARGDYDLRIEAPIAVPDRTSLPEPDVAVVEAGIDPARHPGTALLVIEVAVSSLATDTRIKPALYAAAGVPDLWVADVAARRLHVFRDPGPDGYAAVSSAIEGTVEPVGVPVDPLDVPGLFAGL